MPTPIPAPSESASTAGRLITLFVVTIPLLGLFFAIHQLWDRQVNGLDLAICGILYLLTGLGITVGFHRLITHRSFATPPPIRAALLILGSMAVEGDAVTWVSTHLEHHAHSDREGDPHSPREGFWHAHLGWMMGKFKAKPDVYARHLKNDLLVQAISRTFLYWVVLSLAVPALADGLLSSGSAGGFGTGFWHGLLWGGLVRICVTHHITWSVNSLCHTFGRRPFDATRDSSRNNWLVGVLAFGEGWHNNHHAFPSAAYHGFRWWQIDVSAYVIRLLKLLGLASKIQMPTKEAMERQLSAGKVLVATQRAS